MPRRFAANLVGDGDQAVLAHRGRRAAGQGAAPVGLALDRSRRIRRRPDGDFYGPAGHWSILIPWGGGLTWVLLARCSPVAVGECFVRHPPEAARGRPHPCRSSCSFSRVGRWSRPSGGGGRTDGRRSAAGGVTPKLRGSSSTPPSAGGSGLPLSPSASTGDSTDRGAPDPGRRCGSPRAGGAARLPPPFDAGQIRGACPHVAPAMVRLFLLDQYDDAELDPEEDGGDVRSVSSLKNPRPEGGAPRRGGGRGRHPRRREPGAPGRCRVLSPATAVPGLVKEISRRPADVGGGFRGRSQGYRHAAPAGPAAYARLAVSPRHRRRSAQCAELLPASGPSSSRVTRRRVEQLQHGVLAFQLWAGRVWRPLAPDDPAVPRRRGWRSDPGGAAASTLDPPRSGTGVDPLEGHPGAGAPHSSSRGCSRAARRWKRPKGYDIEEIDSGRTAGPTPARQRGRPRPHLPHCSLRRDGRGLGQRPKTGSRRRTGVTACGPGYPERSAPLAEGAEVAIYDEIGAFGVSAMTNNFRGGAHLRRAAVIDKGSDQDIRCHIVGFRLNLTYPSENTPLSTFMEQSGM